jgi:hypothetical protein
MINKLNLRQSRPMTLGLCSMACMLSTATFADIYHYNNVIIGERAQGLGGAYTAVADDASGVYYNPAGLAFAQSNDISGSANAFYSKKVTYKDVFEGQDFIETSNGTFAPFFGAMQKLDKYVKGLVGGFAYYNIDTELSEQKDEVKDAVVDASVNNKYIILRRTLNLKRSSTGASVGLGYRMTPSLSLGFALTYLNYDELTQSFLSVQQTYLDGRFDVAQNIRDRLTTYGLEPAFGVQWAPFTKLSTGFVIKKGQFASSKYVKDTVKTQLVYKAPTGTSVKSETVAPATESSANPIGSPPLQARLGVAYFASPELLATFDLSYTAAVDDIDSSYKELNKRAAVLNEHIGVEYYMTPSMPLRLGLFTNNDGRKDFSAYNIEKIDYKGATIFMAWAQPNSQIALGTILQKGTGKAHKVSSTTEQSVEAFSYTIAFSATHSF